MNKTEAHGFKDWASVISGAIFALLVSAMATTTVSAALPGEDSDVWSLRKESGDIHIYTMRQSDSSFQAFKAEALIDAPIESIMAVMQNPASCMEWLLNCTESYAVGKGNFHERYVYSVNDLPWPVTDRDYVLSVHTQGSKASGEIVMQMSAVPEMRAEVSNRVRVDLSNTRYRLIPENGKTRMIWLQHTDPKGALPGWLVNTLLVDIPVSSLEELERVASKERYQGFSLIYDESGQLVDVRQTSGN
ncbi:MULTISPECIES: START domain-containing protein [Marinobacter]|uniref:START domain-containing protein n=1 Tax=Marinobacter xiaoshiensis TaxID=3073652 RepID=A0ABU2HMF2_9GAMM|nr:MULTISPECIES: START domain-containing protein [unclassified Marinobacter]MBK1872867.1 START domain-containing protein [Marinobacter sp. 1-3A]MDS1311840.1 START domain-containing protein [Marinobacter sp. F60267]